ncbi:hypothetical protein VULLAG_LOCUS4230 [Vulpes lagopus]
MSSVVAATLLARGRVRGRVAGTGIAPAGWAGARLSPGTGDQGQPSPRLRSVAQTGGRWGGGACRERGQVMPEPDGGPVSPSPPESPQGPTHPAGTTHTLTRSTDCCRAPTSALVQFRGNQ